MRVSTSFSEEDLEILDLILSALLRGGGYNDVRVLLKRPAFGGLLHRIKGLLARAKQPAPASATPQAYDPSTDPDVH